PVSAARESSTHRQTSPTENASARPRTPAATAGRSLRRSPPPFPRSGPAPRPISEIWSARRSSRRRLPLAASGDDFRGRKPADAVAHRRLATSRLLCCSAPGKIVRGWPCDADAVPLRGRAAQRSLEVVTYSFDSTCSRVLQSLPTTEEAR